MMASTECVGACLLCGEEGTVLYPQIGDDLYGHAGDFGELRCPACGLIWLSPRPVQEEMGEFYRRYYTHASVPDSTPADGSRRVLGGLRDAIRSMIFCGFYGYTHLHSHHTLCGLGKLLGRLRWLRLRATNELKELVPRYRQDGLLLDIGCGRGGFLQAMQGLGWQVLGVEGDPEAAALARRSGLPVHATSFEEAKIPSDAVDHITMNHVIEHVYDPLAVMAKCHRILKPGGSVVLYTPNTRSLGHRRFRGHWRPLEAPRHLHCFSPATLRALLARSGFRHIKLWTSPRLAPGIYDASVLIEHGQGTMAHDPAPQPGRRWFSIRERTLCALGWPSGEELVATATKPSAAPRADAGGERGWM
ncbi:MAG TPA: class I SAM-dependent methyltransferase [Candidatus Methylomirabilis sp.]|nr:class I SAM-dependent methyltransferase [Candidatus Methylomirabilis sp.]